MSEKGEIQWHDVGIGTVFSELANWVCFEWLIAKVNPKSKIKFKAKSSFLDSDSK